MKAKIDTLWSLFLTLQQVSFLPMYEVNIPANVELYFIEFRKVINFEYLKPDIFIGLIWPEVTI
jgi:hypothetical protein